MCQSVKLTGAIWLLQLVISSPLIHALVWPKSSPDLDLNPVPSMRGRRLTKWAIAPPLNQILTGCGMVLCWLIPVVEACSYWSRMEAIFTLTLPVTKQWYYKVSHHILMAVSHKNTNLPYVLVKWAITIDGSFYFTFLLLNLWLKSILWSSTYIYHELHIFIRLPLNQRAPAYHWK